MKTWRKENFRLINKISYFSTHPCSTRGKGNKLSLGPSHNSIAGFESNGLRGDREQYGPKTDQIRNSSI